MTRVISLHSFRPGTGKTNITASLAYFLAAESWRVGVLDGDLLTPGLFRLFGLVPLDLEPCLCDYLLGQASLSDAVTDVGWQRELPDGSLFFLPCVSNQSNPREVNEECLTDFRRGFDDFSSQYQLDYLLVDTHSGINDVNLTAGVLADEALILIQPDQQAYQGTALLTALLAELREDGVSMVINNLTSRMDPAHMKKQVETAFGFPVLGMVPFSEALAGLESKDILAFTHPDHAVTREIQKIGRILIS